MCHNILDTEEFLESAKELIRQDQYTIIARDENEELLENYLISEDDRKQILLDLEIDDFSKVDKNRNLKFSGLVYIFKKKVYLTDRYLNEDSLVPLYIKMSSQLNDHVIVISFHE